MKNCEFCGREQVSEALGVATFGCNTTLTKKSGKFQRTLLCIEGENINLQCRINELEAVMKPQPTAEADRLKRAEMEASQLRGELAKARKAIRRLVGVIRGSRMADALQAADDLL